MLVVRSKGGLACDFDTRDKVHAVAFGFLRCLVPTIGCVVIGQRPRRDALVRHQLSNEGDIMLSIAVRGMRMQVHGLGPHALNAGLHLFE